MTIAVSLQQQIAAIKARIDTVAATATPEDIVMLAKAVEAIAGQVTVFDVMAAGEGQVEAIAAASAAASTEIDIARTTALTDLQTTLDAAQLQANQLAFNTPALHAAALLF